jgi:isoaspartyl peptidase/L-asparaginase-like protein (Ntn-hydrolase superfamily)
MTRLRAITHGGAGSNPDHVDGNRKAVQLAIDVLESGDSPLEAACRAVADLEDDERFNAGSGSNPRDDGTSVQMDAACSTPHAFGAVAVIEDVRNPVLVAREVLDTDALVLAGRGAQSFGREHGHEAYEVPARSTHDADTVGALVHDDIYAAALSSGGTRAARDGRVGDVPLPRAGLRVGEQGAIAATGHGETIVEHRVADRAYERIVGGNLAQTAIETALDGVDAPLGLIALGPDTAAADANRPMAYSERAIASP